MQLEESYGTYIKANPCSDIIGGRIVQASVKMNYIRDHYISDFDAINEDTNYYMEEVCAETNGQR